MTQALHIGLMVPINNTTFAQEVLVWMPPGSRATTLRIPRGKGMLTTDTLPAYKAAALELAAQFKGSDVDVVAYGCTAAGFIFGPQGDAELAQELHQVTAKPVVTTARSMVLSLQAAGVNDIALVTPYLDAVNTQLKAFLADGGIRVRRFNSFFSTDVDALGRITAEQVKEMVLQTNDDGCQAVFIACAQLPTATILEELREILGKPVLSSNWGTTHQAQLAMALT